MPEIVPARLRLSRAAGFDLQVHSLATNGLPARSVARPGKWGNPWVVVRSGPRWMCRVTGNGKTMLAIDEREAREVAWSVHRRWALFDGQGLHRDWIGGTRLICKGAVRDELRGKNLACWCPLPTEGEADCCHAAVLLEIANA